MSANVESMFYTREKPWHGMGTPVETAPTSGEALRLAGLDWTVVSEPVFFMEINSVFGSSMTEIPGYTANVRIPDGLGAMKLSPAKLSLFDSNEKEEH